MTSKEEPAIHRALQEITEMLHFATDRTAHTTFKSLKLNIKTAGIEEDLESCLFHLRLQSSSADPEEFLSNLTQTRDSELLSVLNAMQLTEDESHLCVQYFQSAGLVTQKSFQVQHHEDQSTFGLQCIKTSTKSSKKTGGITLHLRILISKNVMMLECQKIYKYLWLFKMFNPQTHLEFNMTIFENLCESDFSCTSVKLSESPLEICGNPSYFLRNTSYSCSAPCLKPVCSEIIPLCLRTEGSSLQDTASLQVVAHMDFIQSSGESRQRNGTKKGLIKLYIFGSDAAPVLPVVEDGTEYQPLEQVPWSVYGLNFYPTSVSRNDRFSSNYAALLESAVPQTYRMEDSRFILFIHLHFNIKQRTAQKKLEFHTWLRKNYPRILDDHQKDIEPNIAKVVNCLLRPHTKTDKKTESYSKAIPNMARSIAYILSHSTDEEFRRNSFSLLSINNSRDAESEVTNRLWNIAGIWCGIIGQVRREPSSGNVGQNGRGEQSPTGKSTETIVGSLKTVLDNSSECELTENSTPEITEGKELDTNAHTHLLLEQEQDSHTAVNHIGQRPKTSTGSRQDTLKVICYLGNQVEDMMMTNRAHETSPGHMQVSDWREHNCSDQWRFSQKAKSNTSAINCDYADLGQEACAGYCEPEFGQQHYKGNYLGNLVQETSTECDFTDLGQECDVNYEGKQLPRESGLLMHKSKLRRYKCSYLHSFT
ncbi:uncharacterized protein [Argopecten irradians]|uniref:uncharacterized protein isoform X2 n=1 Tax=Argopecten irradians TaxID=31199 RepID=UPI003720D98C